MCKLPDLLVLNVDIGDPLILLCELLHRLLAPVGHRHLPFSLLFQLDLLAVGHILGDRRFQQTPGEFAAVDNQHQSFLFHVLLHLLTSPSQEWGGPGGTAPGGTLISLHARSHPPRR